MVPVGSEVSAGHLDKLVHVCEYLLFAWLLANALQASEVNGPRPARVAFLLATAYGAFLELLQGFVPWRSMDLLDAAVNAAGAAAGAWLSRRVPKRLP